MSEDAQRFWKRVWKNEFLEIALALFIGIGFILLIVVLIAIPCCWFEGHAKSAYLRQVQGIEMPWYYAAFISVDSHKVNAEVNLETTKKP